MKEGDHKPRDVDKLYNMKKARQCIHPLETPERKAALSTPDFIQVRPTLGLLTYRTVRQ